MVLYTTHCPKCKVLEQKLAQKGVSYDICEDRETMEVLGFETVPMLDIGDKVLDFGEAVRYLNNLEEK